jgi:3'-5' exoribonuclease
MPDDHDGKTFVSDLEEGSYVQTPFLARDKEIRTTKHDKPYLCVTLGDRSGTIEGRGWEDAEMLAERFEADDFVHVSAKVDSYKGTLQLKVSDLRRLDDEAVELEDYFPHSEWSADDMFRQLLELIDRHVRSDAVRRFLGRLVKRDDIVTAFKRAPAAQTNHHEYFGGLLEHCLSMARIGVQLARHYAQYYPGFLDQDLVVAGCLLHDIGKIDELSYERSVEYSTDGKMIGHITQGVELVTEVARDMEPPPDADLIRHLKHLVLSHHGHREYGSPVEPKTPEAMLLHHVDMIDSRMNLLHGRLEEHRSGPRGDEEWTNYDNTMESSIYAGPAESPEWARPLAPDPETLEGPGLSRQDESDATAEKDADGEPIDEDDATLDMFGD